MKKAQVWQLDFLLAIVISTFTLIIFVNFALEQTSSTDLTKLAGGASSMSESLMTQGLPLNWDKETVRSIGILAENGRVNNTKLNWFYNMTQSEYRTLLSQRNLYHVQLFQDDVPLTISNKDFVGFNKENATSAITVSRYVLYNGIVTRLEVTMWE